MVSKARVHRKAISVSGDRARASRSGLALCGPRTALDQTSERGALNDLWCFGTTFGGPRSFQEFSQPPPAMIVSSVPLVLPRPDSVLARAARATYRNCNVYISYTMLILG